jgi:MFS transporter, ACS family, hexuronate transporter
MQIETQPPVAANPVRRSWTIPHLRWWITALLFFSTVINYMDRQNLSILARTIQDELKISDMQYAGVVQAFLLAYTLSYIVAGRIADRIGTRASMALFVVWWSISDMLTSFSRSVWSLGFFRFMLGIGEPGNYTAAPKAVSEWFPPKERGLVIGIYTAGATLGATIAPPVIAYLSATVGWRYVFVCTGSLGLLWLIPWLWLYRKPEEHPHAGAEELELIRRADEESAIEQEDAAAPAGGVWKAILSKKATWLLMVGRMITDPVWYFYLFWFPKYLTDSRHLTLPELARIAWLVYLAADIGCVTGGYLSGWLIRRGFAPPASRMRVMALAAMLLPLSPFVAYAPTPLLAVLIAAIAAFAHLAWQISLSTLIVDIYPKRLVGTVFGLIAAGSGFGGMVSMNLVGRAVTFYSYTPVFIAMACLHPLAYLLIRGVGKREVLPGRP